MGLLGNNRALHFLKRHAIECTEKTDAWNHLAAQSVVVGHEQIDAGRSCAHQMDRVSRTHCPVLSDRGVSCRGLKFEWDHCNRRVAKKVRYRPAISRSPVSMGFTRISPAAKALVKS